MAKLSLRAALYLRTIDDWKAPFEVSRLLGDTPPPSSHVVRSVLGRLISRGLAEYGGRDADTYRVTEAGRLALAQAQEEDKANTMGDGYTP